MSPSTRKYGLPLNGFQLRTCWASTLSASLLRMICLAGATVALGIRAGEGSASNAGDVWKSRAVIEFGWERWPAPTSADDAAYSSELVIRMCLSGYLRCDLTRLALTKTLNCCATLFTRSRTLSIP